MQELEAALKPDHGVFFVFYWLPYFAVFELANLWLLVSLAVCWWRRVPLGKLNLAVSILVDAVFLLLTAGIFISIGLLPLVFVAKYLLIAAFYHYRVPKSVSDWREAGAAGAARSAETVRRLFDYPFARERVPAFLVLIAAAMAAVLLLEL